jgi:hypothetical protein
MLAHLRTEAYPVYARHLYPPDAPGGAPTYERNVELIAEAKRRAGAARVAGTPTR